MFNFVDYASMLIKQNSAVTRFRLFSEKCLFFYIFLKYSLSFTFKPTEKK